MTINLDNIDDLYIEAPRYLGPSAKQKLYVNDTLIWAKLFLTFDERGGNSVSDKTVYYKRAYGTLPTTSKTGHTFNGWFTDETWGTEVTEETTCNQVDNHTLYAKLDMNYYTITFKNYQGSVVNTQSVSYGSTPSTPSGTADTAQYDYSWPTINSVTKNITYQETRTVKSYTVTWYKYGKLGKDWAKTETLNYGSVSTAPTGTPDTAEYDYSWPKSSTTVTGLETISETRTVKSYTVTWKDWNGTTLKTQSVAYGKIATPPTQPTRTGYTFSSWSGTYTNVTSNRTITATYTLNTASNWVYLGTSGYSYNLDLDGPTHERQICPTSTAANTDITIKYPPSRYAIGTIARVKVYMTSLFGREVTQCATYFFEAR